ncbi:D-tyrosyl-tRNA(Tyr) deacylase [Candidatus Roizmanbacteria bacterium RIFCSPHIGHO2_12_FULL_33_9]|uniref:D-aminoacyl-tRNA deacylase n=1 Tax=Candidatus Roizmanbacteria bacterium RIFCSPHIGHO2_12_FULL_33_9 TaxID=1802045 RepID=A0A1F7HGS5_9BACT|nr:MAG: D-tyrosyl-tRNA(Tyr) deacylase [Candidatus Roizmanbacteria bacterium RIFCSPHIGHO2_12_FULL_33_9]
MISLIQRVTKAKVSIKRKEYASTGKGYVILLGIFEEDNKTDVKKLVDKIVGLRIMSDNKDKMNLSIKDVNGEILLVSQFTLCADVSEGRRPSFIKAKEPKEAEKLYELFAKQLRNNGIKVKTGSFGDYMEVAIFNDGPVTIILDSKSL